MNGFTENKTGDDAEAKRAYQVKGSERERMTTNHDCHCELCDGTVGSSPQLDEAVDTARSADNLVHGVNGLQNGTGEFASNGLFGHQNGVAESVSNQLEEYSDQPLDCMNTSLTATDGMDSYLRENLHLLTNDLVDTEASTPEAGPRLESLSLDNDDYVYMTGPGNGEITWSDYAKLPCSTSKNSGMQSSKGYGSDKDSQRGSDYDSDEGGVYVLPDDIVLNGSNRSPHAVTNLNDSSEDQGDFIETDIARNGGSGDSSNSNSRKESVSSSYEDLRASNICPPRDRDSHDDETFTKLVFAAGTQPSYSHSYSNVPASAATLQNGNSSGLASRPTNLFGANTAAGLYDRANIMMTSASTGSSSPFTISSAAFMSPSYSENSTSALNAPTSESSVFVSPEHENGAGRAAARREAFTRNQSMDVGTASTPQCPLRPAKSSGDLEHNTTDKDEFARSDAAMPVSHSLYQDLSASASPGRQVDRHVSLMCRHCNKQHGNDRSSALRRSGSAGVSVVEGNDQACVLVSDRATMRSNSEELLDEGCCPPAVCLSCHSQRFGTYSCDRNDCDVLEQAMRRHQCCIHGRCTCSLSFYFSCVTDAAANAGASDAGIGQNLHSNSASPSHSRSQSSQQRDVRPAAGSCSRHRATGCLPSSNRGPCNLSRRVHHFIHHLHRIGDDAASVNGHSSRDRNRDRNHSPDTRQSVVERNPEAAAMPALAVPPPANPLDRLPTADQPETQENEHNDNIENGRVMSRHSCISPHHNNNVSGRKQNGNASACSVRARDDKTSTGGGRSLRGGSMSLLPLLLRSATSIDDMDQQVVMELSSMLHHDDENDDDGYVDFQKILRQYMLRKFYEKHGVTSQMYVCDVGLHEKIDTEMVWTEYQAYLCHVRQLGRSSCGATAAVNVLKALGVELDQDVICDAIKTNLRNERASVTEYLLSRSVAGTTAEEVIAGVQRVTQRRVYGRFFHTYPRRWLCVCQWLSDWIKRGAVPMLTLNLQKAVPSGYAVPDAWHHQMVFGVSQQGIFLTNPQEIVPEHVVMEQLSSDGVLLVQRDDVVLRFPTATGDDLRPLLMQADPRWRIMNVLGQVVNMLREQQLVQTPLGARPQYTQYVRIPAWYQAGITVFINTENSHYELLKSLPELPLSPDWQKHTEHEAHFT